MLNINDIQNEIDTTEGLADQSQAAAGGGNFERSRLPMGKHPVRLVGYVELGMQDAGTYDGAQKPDEEQARMTFEFLGKRTVVAKEDGTGDFAPRKSVTKKLSLHPKAGFFKLFQAMRAGDSTITHMANMIGKQAWIVTVTWRTKDDAGHYITIKNKKEADNFEQRLKDAKTDADKKNFRIFDNVDWNSIAAPVVPVLDEDGEDTGESKPLKVRSVVGGLQMFLWDNPKPMFWESLFIAGTYTKKVDGKDVEVSKNYLQEIVLGAKNYEGSPLQGMLEGLDDLPGVADKEPAGADEAEADDIPEEKEPEVTGTTEGDEMDELFSGQQDMYDDTAF